MVSMKPVPTRTRAAVALGLVLAVVPALVLAVCPTRCHAWPWCCPCYVHHSEGPPHLWWHLECGRPVCPPCDSEFYGYYPTCWRAMNVCPNCPNGDPPWIPQKPVPPVANNPYPMYYPEEAAPQTRPQQGAPSREGSPSPKPPSEDETPTSEEGPVMDPPGAEPGSPVIPELPPPRLKPTSVWPTPRPAYPQVSRPVIWPRVQNSSPSVLPASYPPPEPR
jgi:hypothetical protein